MDISSISNDTFEIEVIKRITGSEAPSRARRPIQSGDVLFSNVRTYLRNVAIVPEGLDAQLCSTGFTVLRSNVSVEPRFLFRYLLTDEFIDRISTQQTGTHYPATSDSAVMAELLTAAQRTNGRCLARSPCRWEIESVAAFNNLCSDQ